MGQKVRIKPSPHEKRTSQQYKDQGDEKKKVWEIEWSGVRTGN